MTAPVPGPPGLTWVGRLEVRVAEPVEVGPTVAGTRRLVAVLGGSLEGDIGSGRVLPGGADWQWVHDDGSVTIDAEYVIELAEGDRMTLRSIGVRTVQPSGPAHFRTAIVFSALPERRDLAGRLYVSTGERVGDLVRMDLFRVD